jgi:hypothetical protein
MFRDESVQDTSDWCGAQGDRSVRTNDEKHREIDRALRGLARRRASLDVEEARWLRLGEQHRAWRKLGYVHALEYLEDVFGFSPRTAKERLRVARELGELPTMESALEAGDLNYSVVRELTRVATSQTVERWMAAARGKNLRQVEQLVAGHKKGNDPDDAPDPKLVKHGVWLELDAESLALFRQARAAMSDEMGRTLDDKAVIMEMSRATLAGTVSSASGSENNDRSGSGEHAAARASKPTRMVHVITCPDCKRGWQDGAGVRVELSAAAIERATCDAIVVDDERGVRARSVIPERTRRKVMARDGHKCTVPGCRSARNLEVHHIVHQEDGGDHREENLTTLCGGHHTCHHDRVLQISGSAPDRLVFARNGLPLQTLEMREDEPGGFRLAKSERFAMVRANAGASKNVDEARQALTQMGFKVGVARQAVERARAHVGTDSGLERLIREALRHCA